MDTVFRPFGLVLFVLVAAATPGYVLGGPVGSYTFIYAGTAPKDTSVRITAAGADNPASVIDIQISIAGLTKDQAANLVMTEIGGMGSTELNGTNSLKISSIEDKNNHNVDVKQVDGGTTSKDYEPLFDGSVKNLLLVKGDKFKLAFAPEIFPGGTIGGNIIIAVDGGPTLSTSVPDGVTSAQAAQALFSLLQQNGFPDVQLDPTGTSVSVSEDPSGAAIDTIDEFGFTGANLHVSLVMPSVVPEPPGLVLLALGMLGVFGYGRYRGARSPRIAFHS